MLFGKLEMRNLLSLVMATSCLALAPGCTPHVAERTHAEFPKKNKVQRLVHEHFVVIPAHHAKLGDSEKRNLNAFLNKNVSNPYAVTVYVEEFGGHSEERIKMITSILRDYGIKRDSIIVDDYDAPKTPHAHKGSGLHLIVEGFVVIPPNCMNWTEELGGAKGARTTSNFGCSDAINFGMMVSDPRDLVVGRETGAYDGTRHALDVKMYHEDKIKPLKVEEFSAGSGSSSQGQSSGSGGI